MRALHTLKTPAPGTRLWSKRKAATLCTIALHCTHCSTKDPFSRRFTKHDYFYAHRIIFYVSFQIEKQIHINKYVLTTKGQLILE